MAYTLYLDKTENFECEMAVKNATLKEAFARIIIESDNMSLMFPGVLKDGKCHVPIKRLKGLLEENSKGKMHLEVIVEDTYFRPWEDNFIVEQHTDVKVQVKEQKEQSTKPILEVKIKEPAKKPLKQVSVPAKEIVTICDMFKINSKNYNTTKRTEFKQVLKEYFKENVEFKNKLNPILNEVVYNLK